MNYKYLKNHQIDKQKWDLFVDQLENPLIYSKSWFLDIVSPNWAAYIDDYWEWVMPVPYKSKFGIPYVVQPLFCQQLGVYGNFNDTSNVNELLRGLSKRFPLVIYQLNRFNNFNFAVKGKYRSTFELPLNDDYTKLLAHFSDSHRKNIKRAERFEQQVVESTDYLPMIDLLKQMYTGKSLDSVKPVHYEILKLIFEHGIKHTASELVYLKNTENQIIAGAFFLNYQNQYVLFTARNQEGFEQKSTFLLLDRFIRKHANSSKYLDFAGSDIKGIADFNKGWGANEHKYFQFHHQWI